MGMGKGSSAGTTTVQQTPEQAAYLKASTNFLTGTAFPAYQSTVGGAKNVLEQITPSVNTAVQNAINTSNRANLIQQAGGTGAYLSGLKNIQGLFTPEYKQQQIQAALQPATEQERELMNQQSSLYGGAGGLGSSRQALASENLASLGRNRLANIAAQVSGNVETQRQNAANTLLNVGQTSLDAAQKAAGLGINYAMTPQDIFSKYASVVYGIPQQNTTPNFAGTQGSTTSGSSKSSGFRL